MTYKDTFTEIESTKDKYKISNALWSIMSLEPEDDFIPQLIALTKKPFEIKTASLNLLSRFNNPNKLESFLILGIQTEKNKTVIEDYIKGFELNGREKAFVFLLELYKENRSTDIRNTILYTLNRMALRTEISEPSFNQYVKLLGNNYCSFGCAKSLKSTKRTTINKWQGLAESQMLKNSLNLLYVHDDDFDFHICIEKMRKDYIRYIKVIALNKKHKRNFSKYYTQEEQHFSIERLFDSILDKSKESRIDENLNEIIRIIESEMIPQLISKLEIIKSLETLEFNDFVQNENQIYSKLFGLDTSSWITTHLMTKYIQIFCDNADKNKYIDFFIEKWKNGKRASFAMIDYLDNQRITAGNNKYT